jgi:multimeric flavodoxin WrbA
MKLDLKIINEQALIRLREAEVAFPCDGCDDCDDDGCPPQADITPCPFDECEDTIFV